MVGRLCIGLRQPPEGGKASGVLSAEVVEEELATLYAEILEHLLHGVGHRTRAAHVVLDIFVAS